MSFIDKILSYHELILLSTTNLSITKRQAKKISTYQKFLKNLFVNITLFLKTERGFQLIEYLHFNEKYIFLYIGTL